ncbi:unnamed protein product [Gadus morhua 'NCC']
MVEDAGNSTELLAILGGSAHLKPPPNQTITQPEPTQPGPTPPETMPPEKTPPETTQPETRPRETRSRETRPRNEPRRQQKQPRCAPDRCHLRKATRGFSKGWRSVATRPRPIKEIQST